MKVGVGNRSAETPLGTPRARQYNKREARHLKDEHWWRQGQCPHLCGVLSEIVGQIGRNTVWVADLDLGFTLRWTSSAASDVT